MKYLILILIIFATVASAREISISNIDASLSFTETEKIIVKSGLKLSAEEESVLNIVLGGGSIDVSQINNYVSAINKLQKEKPLTSNEIKYLLKGQANEKIKYLSRKKIMDI